MPLQILTIIFAVFGLVVAVATATHAYSLWFYTPPRVQKALKYLQYFSIVKRPANVNKN